MRKTEIGLIDDCSIARKLLKGFLYGQQHQSFNVVFELESLLELGGVNPKKCRPDIIFLDMDLPEMTGLDGIPILLKYFPHCRIIMFTDTEDKEAVIKALDIGARGYLKKNVQPKELIHAIKCVRGGSIYISPEIIKWRLDHLDYI